MHAGVDTRNVSLEQLVNEASDELLSEPDYSKQLDIVERITARGPAAIPGLCTAVCDAIAARMEKKKKSENVIYLLLHLMDFLLKNVTPQMGHIMSKDSFQKHIVKLAKVERKRRKFHFFFLIFFVVFAKGKTVKGRAMTLMVCKVQEWAYIFQNHKGFQETYIALQKQGHDFPPPSRELMMEQSRLNERRLERAAAKRVEAANANDPLRRLKENLQLLRENLTLVIDILAAIDPATENVRNNELILPLLEPIGQQRSKIAELLGTVTDEETLLVLLDVNDDINAAFSYYNELLQGRRPYIPNRARDDQQPMASSPPQHNSSPISAVVAPGLPMPGAPPPYTPSQPAVPLVQIQAPPPYQPPVAAPSPDDPFAALARARHAKVGLLLFLLLFLFSLCLPRFVFVVVVVVLDVVVVVFFLKKGF